VGRYRKKHSPTHTHTDHQTSTVIHTILLVQFTCLTVLSTTYLQVLFDLHVGLGPSTLYFIHFFSHNLIFATHAHSIAACFAVVPMLCRLFLISLSPPNLEICLYPNATHPSDHSHFCSLMCHVIFFPYRPGLTSMQHSVSHTTAVQSFSHNQWYIFIGMQWYQLLKFIPASSNSGLHSRIRISIHTQHVTKLIHLLQLCTGTNIYTSATCTSYRIQTAYTNK